MNLLLTTHVHSIEATEIRVGKSRAPEKEGAVASFAFVSVDARCPLCGAKVLAVNRAGRVLADDVHPIPLGGGSTAGYSLCDDCGVLAHLPTNLTLN